MGAQSARDEDLGLACPHALQLGAARGLDVLAQERDHDELEQGALGQLLAGEELLGSSALAMLAPDGAGSAQGPRALEPHRLFEEEAAGAPPELRRPRGAGCGAAEQTAQESPLRRGRAR